LEHISNACYYAAANLSVSGAQTTDFITNPIVHRPGSREKKDRYDISNSYFISLR